MALRIDQIRADVAAAAVPIGPPAGAAGGAIHHNGNGVHLPGMKLPFFTGTSSEFPAFWEAFEEMIDKNNGLTNLQKITYLFGQIKGSALEVVAGLPLTAASYAIAVSLLQ